MADEYDFENLLIDRVGTDGRIYLIERQVDRVLGRPAQQWNVRTKDGGV